MLASTQQVVFVDSVVVDKTEFLNAYLLNPERSHKPDILARSYLGVELESAPAGEGSLFDEVPEAAGPDRRLETAVLLPLSALLGAVFLIWADVACRVVIPRSELPLGILVSAIGAPSFVWLLVRKSYGFGEGRS